MEMVIKMNNETVKVSMRWAGQTVGFRGAILAAALMGCGLGTPVPTTVSITVDRLGNGTLVGPAGPNALPASAAADPGPGGLGSVLTYNLLNPPNLVFGDVQIVNAGVVTQLIRFNAANVGSPASLLFYSSEVAGTGVIAPTPTPPTVLYPNVVSVAQGTVYTPGPGQPGYVSALLTHYSFSLNGCAYSLSPGGQSFGPAGGSGSFTVTTGTGCPISALVSGDFLSASVDGTTVHFTVGPNVGLGQRTGTISVGDQLFTVTQTGERLTLTIKPQRLTFISGPTTAPPPQKVNVTGGEGLPFTVSANQPWITVAPNSTTLPATLTISVNPAGLKGLQTGAVTLSVGGITATIGVSFFVEGLPSLVVVPDHLTFTYAGTALPVSQQLNIYSTSPVPFTAAGGDFVSVTPGSGTTTRLITVTVDPSKVGTGTFSGSVTLTASGVTNSPVVVPVKLIVTPFAPQIGEAGVVNAASFSTGPIAPGSMFSIFGTRLADSKVTAPGPSIPLSLGDVSITIGGVAAPVQFISPEQINAQVPFEVTPGPHTLTLTVHGFSSSIQVTVDAVAAGIFRMPERGAILNEDLTPNTPEHPAIAGSTVIVFFTGQGLVTPAVATGAPAPMSPLSFTNAITSSTVGTEAADVSFSGLAPGFAGLGQANVTLPNLTTTKDYPLVLLIDGNPSNAATVAVRAK